MFPSRHIVTNAQAATRQVGTTRLALASIAACLSLMISPGSASAHSYPQLMDPSANARLDTSPPHVGITYDSNIVQNGTLLKLLGSTATAVPVQADSTSGRQSSVQPVSDLAPGPYTVAWT